MQALRTGKLKQVDDAYDTGIGTQFSVETNKRDEDEEMMKYIEEQLAKRKGNKAEEVVVDVFRVDGNVVFLLDVLLVLDADRIGEADFLEGLVPFQNPLTHAGPVFLGHRAFDPESRADIRARARAFLSLAVAPNTGAPSCLESGRDE